MQTNTHANRPHSEVAAMAVPALILALATFVLLAIHIHECRDMESRVKALEHKAAVSQPEE